MIEAHLALARANAPLLLVTIPVIAAAAAFIIGHARASWAIAAVAAVLTAVLAIDLAMRAGGASASAHGLAADALGAFLAAALAGAVALCAFAGGARLNEYGGKEGAIAFALALSAAAAWCAALFAADLLTLILASEAAWLATTGLVALGGARDRAALNGALRMLIAGGAGAALALLGLAMIAQGVGGDGLTTLAALQPAAPTLAAAGVALVFVSLALKAGIAPLHFWLAPAIGRTQAFAALVLGAVGIVGALAVAIRLASYAVASPAIGDGMALLLALLGAGAIIIGSMQAIGAQTLPRLIGYAMSVQGGCVFITLALGSPAAFAAALVQVLAACGAALALLAGASVAGEARAMSALDGLGRRAPLASAAIVSGALGLMGAPLTLGFLGRWRMIETAVGVGWWWAAGAAIAASLAGVFYGGRLIERVFFRRATETSAARGGVWAYALAPVLAAAIVINLLGLDPGMLLDAAARASQSMADVAR